MSDEVSRLAPYQLDRFAVACGRSAAVVFEHNGWVWLDDVDAPYMPDAAAIAMCVRRLLDEIKVDEADDTRSSRHAGRMGVSRFVEDEVEQATAWVELGVVAGDDHLSGDSV